ncbi:4-hydroxybenzoate-octaprenyltransferase (plasmid) [Legionella adelaidensis]|uniref:4-hydroxybenzoate octaprenyltransferase n=1 Tax=Legionella adelaidensis TaxID=45056 RepID=A0A0W0R597_9GAMM|nr:4-hydroxybenzoate octaprenyltransferase [Legionella adelaidensis]KTC66219.1 4-hydroxybenzoate-octaprenyltransferase [Legionella adelaidensis]VEH85477.1 4-hydroxybenzoate-octaprenyltransferase [Legionella adelaidensis]
MNKWHEYLHLMRFNKPIGIFLLWWPTAWALWIANEGMPNLVTLLYFVLGTVIMRAAGCVINDIADRNFDDKVARTVTRPLATKKVSLYEAFLLLIGLLSAALVILVQLPPACFDFALIALFIIFVYPFCKRFFPAPQFVLGLAFSMGIPMAYIASHQSLNAIMALLVLINSAWIIAYDTQYAMVDREDDVRIGVKSTAILFAHLDVLIITLLQCFSHALWLLLALLIPVSLKFYICWVFGGFLLYYQYGLIKDRKPASCFKAFMNNNWYGLIMWLGLM